MKRLILASFIFAITLIPGWTHAYSSDICKTGGEATCSEQEVGPFMKGISEQCGNLGDCTLEDIMTVFVNVGNYIVGIIGAIVLLMYVVGGFYWLASAGRKEWVDKGKKYMTISTAGLLIVMFSYLGIITLRTALDHGTFLDKAEDYVTCTGEETKSEACALNSKCDKETGWICLSECAQELGDMVDTDAKEGDKSTVTWFDCVDINSYPTSSSAGGIWINTNSCGTDLCPGSATVQCCQLETYQ